MNSTTRPPTSTWAFPSLMNIPSGCLYLSEQRRQNRKYDSFVTRCLVSDGLPLHQKPVGATVQEAAKTDASSNQPAQDEDENAASLQIDEEGEEDREQRKKENREAEERERQRKANEEEEKKTGERYARVGSRGLTF